MVQRLAAQSHRRVIETHTPLDGVPIGPHATFVVVARHPLDAAVSLYHQGNNLDRQRLRELTGADLHVPATPRPPLDAWLSAWIDAMRQRAAELAPNPRGILIDPRAFFRQGISGAGTSVASPSDLARYSPSCRRTGAPGPAGLAAPVMGVLVDCDRVYRDAGAARLRHGSSGALAYHCETSSRRLRR